MQRLSKSFHVGFLLHDVARLRRTIFDQGARPMGITRAQWWTLATVGRHSQGRAEGRHSQEGMVQTKLAELLEIRKVGVGGLIDRLEASGFVTRQPDPNDRRAKWVEITPAGEEILERLLSMGMRLNNRLTRGLSKEDLEIALDVLQQMKKNMIKMSSD